MKLFAFTWDMQTKKFDAKEMRFKNCEPYFVQRLGTFGVCRIDKRLSACNRAGIARNLAIREKAAAYSIGTIDQPTLILNITKI